MNKLGISEYKLSNVEKKIIKAKLESLDYYFTFNNEELNFKYLVDLHRFLFEDIYFEEDLNTRNIDQTEKELFDEIFLKLNNLCINSPNNLEQILLLIEQLWVLQPFLIGNTRTLIAFLKIINEGFLLELNIDTNMEINSSPKMFDINNFVNQKRLTKEKKTVNII